MGGAIKWLFGLAVVAAIAVTGGWYALKPSVEAQLDAIFADAERQGIASHYEAVEIGGFPFGYEAAFTALFFENTTEGWSVRFPTASGAVSALEPDTATFALPERFSLTLTQEIDGERVLISREVTSDNLVARLTRAEDDAVDYDIDADRVRVTPSGVESDDHIEAVDLSIDGRLGGAARNAPDALDMRFTAASATAQIAIESGADALQDVVLGLEGIESRSDLTERGLESKATIASLKIDAADGVSTSEMTMADIAVDVTATADTDVAGSVDAAAADRIAAMLLRAATGGGVAEAKFTTGAWRQTTTAPLAESGPVQTVEFSGAGGDSAVSLAEDRLSLSTTTDALRFAFTGDTPVSGGVETAVGEITYPLRATDDDVQQATLIYKLADITLDEATWAWLDPEQTFTRAMPGLEIDATVGLAIFEDFFSLRDETADAPTTALNPPPVEDDEAATRRGAVRHSLSGGGNADPRSARPQDIGDGGRHVRRRGATDRQGRRDHRQLARLPGQSRPHAARRSGAPCPGVVHAGTVYAAGRRDDVAD